MMNTAIHIHMIKPASGISGAPWVWHDDTFGDPAQPAFIWIASNTRIAFTEALKMPDRFDTAAQNRLLAKAARHAAKGLLHPNDAAAWTLFCNNGFAALPTDYQVAARSWQADSLGQAEAQAMILTTDGTHIAFEDFFKLWDRFTPEARQTIEERASESFQQGLMHPNDARVWLAHVDGGDR
ncbi:hypothetical protein ACMSSJ_13795 [Kerstersia gyiorum]|uniref:hypothetical protein n=1 Tax=Kerstersia gyiorum TaxID=206506 RepID=UPI0039E844EB